MSKKSKIFRNSGNSHFQSNLKQIEIKSWQTKFIDGLFDLQLGLIFVIVGISPWLGDYMQIPLMFMVILGFILVRKYITEPKIGEVKHRKKRKVKLAIVTIALTISVLLGIVAWQGLDVIPVLIGIKALIVFSLMAFFMDYPRLYLYAILIGGGFALTSIYSTITLLLPGLFIATIGAGQFIRFMRKYKSTS